MEGVGEDQRAVEQFVLLALLDLVICNSPALRFYFKK